MTKPAPPPPARRPRPTNRRPATETRTRDGLTRRTRRDGTTAYSFLIDMGAKPNGRRDRRRFTYDDAKTAKAERTKILYERRRGTYVAPHTLTTTEYLSDWLARQRVRENTRAGYVYALKPVLDHLGARPLQALTPRMLDDLITLRQNGRPMKPRAHHGRREREVLDHLRRVRPGSGGTSYAELHRLFGDTGIKSLTRLVDAGAVVRVARGRYRIADDTDTAAAPTVPGGVSARTIGHMLTVLRAALDDAVRDGLLARNVARSVDTPKPRRVEQSAWSTAEVDAFRAHVADDRLSAAWELAVLGLRRSELLALKWSAIDADAGTVTIQASRTVVPGGTVTGDPKSVRSWRVLPVAPEVIGMLLELRSTQTSERAALGMSGPPPADALVVVDELGRAIRPETFSRMFGSHVAAAGLRRIRLHDMRHTAASRLISMGLDPVSAAAWLGHTPTMTLDVYSHPYTATMFAAGRMLASGGAPATAPGEAVGT